MITNKQLAASLAALLMIAPAPIQAANHREAPITALDHKADITDVYAFRSYAPGSTDKVTLIMCVDPLLEPGNGPYYAPFDDDILYEIKIDNNHDAVEDIVFQFRFSTEQRLPTVWQGYVGAGMGITVPAGTPAPIANAPIPAFPGMTIVPPRITNFSSPGLGTRQSYNVTMIKGGTSTVITGGGTFYAVPSNAGPRTMDYSALFAAGTYALPGGISLFAGTTDDAFWIDLGGAFDTLNTSITPVLTPAQDAAPVNLASDYVSGYNVNTIAIEVPISMLTSTGKMETADKKEAVIGMWATTSRARTTIRRAPLPAVNSGGWSQIQRMANPLINELIIGTAHKDRFSMDQPRNDAQFAGGNPAIPNYFLDPGLARVVNAAFGGAVALPPVPRTDLLPLVVYTAPIAPAGTPNGPVADLLRLNTGVAPTPIASANRLGAIAGDLGGFPNGRRVFDDVTDIALRVVAGGVLAAPFPGFTAGVGDRLGDGVNVNDVPYKTSFPYVGEAHSGRTRRHIDPAEPGCTAGAGAPCAP
jgi:hypothetical protein